MLRGPFSISLTFETYGISQKNIFYARLIHNWGIFNNYLEGITKQTPDAEPNPLTDFLKYGIEKKSNGIQKENFELAANVVSTLGTAAAPLTGGAGALVATGTTIAKAVNNHKGILNNIEKRMEGTLGSTRQDMATNLLLYRADKHTSPETVHDTNNLLKALKVSYGAGIPISSTIDQLASRLTGLSDGHKAMWGASGGAPGSSLPPT